MKTFNLSEEKLRVYKYPDGFDYTIHKPVSLDVEFGPNNQEIHLIEDENGGRHTIMGGWRILWVRKKKTPLEEFEELQETINELR